MVEKLKQFETGVISQLKAATEHLDFQAYEESFRRIEQDQVS